jgi:ribosomal protein S12 methylthiotransferase accessory factor YcaO
MHISNRFGTAFLGAAQPNLMIAILRAVTWFASVHCHIASLHRQPASVHRHLASGHRHLASVHRHFASVHRHFASGL